MNSWFRNTITALYNTVSAPVAVTRDALAERLQSVRETASLLYTKAKKKTWTDIARRGRRTS